MDMNTMTLPRKGLKTRPYSMDMEDHIVTLPKKGLKTRPYTMDMNKDIVTLPKKGLKRKPYNIGMEKMDLKTRPYSIDMEKKDLKKLTKGQLIKLLLKKVSNHEDLLDNDPFKDEVAQEPTKRIKPTPPPRTGKWESVKPKPIPCKSVNEDLILPPPDGYKPIPKPRTDRPLKMQHARRPPKPTRKPPPVPQVEEHITNVPVPKIKELNKALKSHEKSYRIELQDNLNPLNHFTKTKTFVESHLESLLKDMKGFKFIETLEVTFVKKIITDSINKTTSLIYKKAFSNGKAKTITKPNDIGPELNISRQEILNMIDQWVSEGSGWAIDRIDSHFINVTLYKPLNGSSYMELPTELRNPKKGLINIKNKDDKCFRWCHIRHLNPQTEHPERIKKEDKRSTEGLNYEGIEFPVSQKHYNKVEKQNSIRINVCLVMKMDNHFPFTSPKRH